MMYLDNKLIYTDKINHADFFQLLLAQLKKHYYISL